MRNIKTIKLIVLSFMLLTLLVIIYGLGFFTDFLPIRSAYKDLYDQLQVFNRTIFNYSFIALIPAAVMYFLDHHKTNQYGVANKVVALVGSVFSLYHCWFVLSQLNGLKEQYKAIEPEKVQLLYPDYVMNDIAFSMGYVIFGLLAVASVAVIVITLVNKKTNEVVKEG